MSGILSPAFLQAAGRAGKERFAGFMLVSLTDDPTISSVSCDGEMTVKTTKGGVEKIETYTDLDGDTLSISADKNTKIYISGNLTGEWEMGGNTYFVSIKGTNTALTQLNCSYCSALQELNLSANTALTQLNCGSCYKIIGISYPATNDDVSTAIAGAITGATADDGTVYTDSAGAYYSTIETAANSKGWTIEQLA